MFQNSDGGKRAQGVSTPEFEKMKNLLKLGLSSPRAAH
jgi:hypothetical protein